MKNKIKLPFLLSLVLAIGILCGNFYATFSGHDFKSAKSGSATPNSILSSTSNSDSYALSDKVPDFLYLLQNFYVDSLDFDSIVETIFPHVVKELDPHSLYIPAKDLEAVNDQLDGSFCGIGVQFYIDNDTINIVDVIANSPSEKVGLQAGDKIVEVNDSAFVGETVSNKKVFDTLRGKKGTEVELGIKRSNTKEILHYTVIRGEIPVKSVDVSYMITPEIGMISVNKFGAKTYEEFRTGVAGLYANGCRKLIIDLRGNSGGYMNACVNMLNEFLSANDLIVYVEGRAFAHQEDRARGNGSFKDMQVVVMIDEFSASASEIFAGAIQDNDRGLIIGRRSFGKGLVQQQMPLRDGSALRITVARYYTPSGRCIQKNYELGHGEEYEEEFYKRFMHGEQFSRDSIALPDSLMFKTTHGRSVYGGGGIMPDIFVPSDTVGVTPYFSKLVNKRVIYNYALDYANAHRIELNTYKTWDSLLAHLQTENFYTKIAELAKNADIKSNSKDRIISKSIILHRLYAYIIRNIQGDEGFFPVWHSQDKTVERAVEALEKGIELYQ